MFRKPVCTVIMAPKRTSRGAVSASKPKRSRDVLSISEKVKILDMIEIGKNIYIYIYRIRRLPGYVARTNLPFMKG